MDVTVKLVGSESGIAGIYSPESMANMETFHGLCGILGSGVFTGERITARELREFNTQLESFSQAGEYVPVLREYNGEVSQESVEDVGKWVKAKLNSVVELFTATASSVGDWWTGYKNEWLGLSKRISELSHSTAGDQKFIPLSALPNPSLFFEDGQLIKNPLAAMSALNKTTVELLHSFAVPYMRSIRLVYMELRRIKVLFTLSFTDYNLVVEKYKVACTETYKLRKFVGEYPGNTSVVEVKTDEYEKIGVVRTEFKGMTPEERRHANDQYGEKEIKTLGQKELDTVLQELNHLTDETTSAVGSFITAWTELLSSFTALMTSAIARMTFSAITLSVATLIHPAGWRVLSLSKRIMADTRSCYSVIAGLSNLNYNFAENYVRLAEKSVRG